MKAVVSSIQADAAGNAASARVIPTAAGSSVSAPYSIASPLRRPGALSVGDEVACMDFEDGTGLVLALADGDIPGWLEVHDGPAGQMA